MSFGVARKIMVSAPWIAPAKPKVTKSGISSWRAMTGMMSSRETSQPKAKPSAIRSGSASSGSRPRYSRASQAR